MAEQTSNNNGSGFERVIDDALLGYLQSEIGLPEMEAFELAAARNPERAETVLAYNALLDSLADELDDVAPPIGTSARARIMSFVESKPISQVIRAADGQWTETGMSGFQFKLLFKDPETKKMTVLARIAAGGRMPPHRHQGAEECLIIEGSLWTDGVLLLAGDYIVTQDQTVHEDTWSPNGALALLKTYLEDVILAG
jgi:quercetin dioxygenase-like cupin family protein